MTELDAQEFVTRFADAWATRDGEAFLAVWHPDGKLHSPFYNRVIAGCEIGKLSEMQKTQLPHLTWTLIGWTWRDNIIVIEWETSNRYGEKSVTWRGVDKLTIREGKIIEEIVYVDTAPIQAQRAGRPFDALVQLPASLV
ncbi:MAG: nuclear transport factor 2 family protein [Acidobacteriota bacterium]